MAVLHQQPGKVVAVHSSYRSRAAERGTMPAWPSYFLEPASSLAASGDPVARPPGCETGVRCTCAGTTSSPTTT